MNVVVAIFISYFFSLVFVAAVLTNKQTHVPTHYDYSINFFLITSIVSGGSILITFITVVFVAAAVTHKFLHITITL